MSQKWAKSNFELVPSVGRYLRKATLNQEEGVLSDLIEKEKGFQNVNQKIENDEQCRNLIG